LEKFAMKKTLIALAALAATTAFAQSTATISGSINVGIMNTGASGAQTEVASLGGGANAININVAEDLGGGLRGGFDSQIRFNAANGDRNSAGAVNALFHTANTYLTGGFGTARIGSIVEAGTCAFDPWGCTGGAALQAGTGISALGGAASVKQAVQYTTPTVNGFSANYTSSLSARTNERQTLGVNYANGPLALTAINIKGSGNSTTDGGTAITDTATSQRAIGASYDFGVARLSFLNTVNKGVGGATTADFTSIGATVPMGAYTLLAGFNKNDRATANFDTKISVGVNYALSKRTTLGADLFRSEELAAIAPRTGTAGSGFVTRIRHTF
jgi:predicted porin